MKTYILTIDNQYYLATENMNTLFHQYANDSNMLEIVFLIGINSDELEFIDLKELTKITNS